MGVCADHFKDPHLRDFIKKNIRETHCDYCDEDKDSADFNELSEFIEEAISTEYSEPYESGAWYDSEGENYEDRFPLNDVEWTLDLLQEFVDVDDFTIIEDLAGGFSNDYWTPTDAIWGPTEGEAFVGGWESLKEILKHKIRFLFFDPSLKNTFEDNESINPYLVLDEAAKAIAKMSLVVEVPAEALKIYRGRQHENAEDVATAKAIGSPPAKNAKANRMSPPGISMFYGASDVETCEREVIDLNWKNTCFTTGCFYNSIPLKLVDFTALPEIPSLFDVQNREKRNVIGFLSAFIKDLSNPVKPDDQVHIEYIPTQVVTEFLKVKLGVHGIVYGSVKNPGHKCTVIFADNEQMANANEIGDSHILVLSNNTVLTKPIVQPPS
jgi:hypothetical protein